uniref:(northern house mosquito) hypothetical protein n=1 Tax=Culex pipiens TaxID=7175 RepID=A0A8D8B1S2_CULPI
MALVLFSQISLVEALAVIQVCHKMVRAQRLACKPLFFVRLHATRSFSLVTNLKRTLSRGVHFGSNVVVYFINVTSYGSNELGKKTSKAIHLGKVATCQLLLHLKCITLRHTHTLEMIVHSNSHVMNIFYTFIC